MAVNFTQNEDSKKMDWTKQKKKNEYKSIKHQKKIKICKRKREQNGYPSKQVASVTLH